MKNIASAIVKAQKEFGPALKTNSNAHFKSKYADLSACIEAVIDALNNNGIALIQQTHDDETGVTVETMFLHESGESITSGKLHVPSSKQDAQGYGSAMTYARRYSLMAACGIAPEDDDGNAASKPRAAPQREQKLDMSPKARAQRITEGVKAGDATGAALALSGFEEKELAAVWGFIDQTTQEKLTAAWPKE